MTVNLQYDKIKKMSAQALKAWIHKNYKKDEMRKMNTYEISQIVQNSKSLPEVISKLRENSIDSVYQDWAMRSYMDFRAREKAVPLKGVFELTPHCNLDCKMCYVHLNAEQMKGCKTLSADEWESVMSQAIDSGMMFASLTGGECLTYPDFERLYLYLYNKSVRIGVLTNAVLLDKEKIEFLKKYPPVSLQVTLYGANEEMYEKVTGKREFARVTENIRCAAEEGLPLKITLTPNPYLTFDENKELIRFASSLGVQFQVNSGLINPREQTERNDSFCDLSVEDYMEFFRLEKLLKGELQPTECVSDLPKTGGKTDESIPKGIRCGGARSSFNITWNGKMVPCNRYTYISAEPLKEGFQMSWTKIHNQVMEILLPVECETCAYRYASKGCAAEHANANLGHASPVQCEWCRAMVKNGFAKTV